jgi:hypothetical protein
MKFVVSCPNFKTFKYAIQKLIFVLMLGIFSAQISLLVPPCLTPTQTQPASTHFLCPQSPSSTNILQLTANLQPETMSTLYSHFLEIFHHENKTSLTMSANML